MDKFTRVYSAIVVMLGRTAVLAFSLMLMIAYVLHVYRAEFVQPPEINLVWYSILLLGGDWAMEKYFKLKRNGGDGK